MRGVFDLADIPGAIGKAYTTRARLPFIEPLQAQAHQLGPEIGPSQWSRVQAQPGDAGPLSSSCTA